MRVLIVDDEPDIRLMLRSALRGHTTEVLEEEDARSIVAVARDHAPDLILLDVLMPGVDGFEAMRALRADEHTRDIPVYMLSALDDTKNIQRAMRQREPRAI